MWFRIMLCVVCTISIVWTCDTVRAEDEAASQAARSLFEQGLDHVDKQQWTEAESAFRQALALRNSPVIRFNLAVTLIELKKFGEATTFLRDLDSDLATSGELRAKLPDLLDSATRRAAKLTIRLSGSTQNAEVRVDERSLSLVELGVLQVLDPGVHVVRLLRSGQELDVRQLEAAEGSEQVVIFELPAVATPREVAAQAVGAITVVPSAPAARSPEHAAAEQADDDARRRRRWWGIGAGTVAVTAGVLTGVLIATRTHSGGPSYEGDFSPPAIGVQVPE